jgi:hypothetical protein
MVEFYSDEVDFVAQLVAAGRVGEVGGDAVGLVVSEDRCLCVLLSAQVF